MQEKTVPINPLPWGFSLFFFSFIAASILFPAFALAGNHVLMPEISLRETYNSNLYYNDISAWETRIIPAISWDYKSPRLKNSFRAVYNIFRYLDYDDYDRTNQSYYLNNSYALSPRMQLSLDLNTDIDHSYNMLEETGEIIGKSKRYRYKISPGISYDLTPRDQLKLNFGYNVLDYEDTQNLDWRDYEVYDLSLQYIHAYSPVTSLLLLASYSRTLPDDLKSPYNMVLNIEQNDYDFSVYQAMLGIRHQYTETITLSCNAGMDYTDSSGEDALVDKNGNTVLTSDIDYQKTGFALDASLDFAWERSTLTFSAQRSITQSATGDSLTRQYYKLNGDYELTELIDMVASAYYIKSENTDEDNNLNQSDNTDVITYSLAPGLRWKISPKMSLEMRYDYRKRDDKEDDDDDDVHKTYLQFNYKLDNLLKHF